MADISFSRMSTYMQCPKKFYWHYIERWSPVQDADHFVLGKMVHDGIQRLLGGDSLESVIAGISHKDLTGYKTALTMKATASRIVKAAHSFVVTLKPVEDAQGKVVEREIRHGGLVGIIDCFHTRMDGSQQVLDWKTAGEQYEEHVKRLSGQLTMYQVLLESAGHTVDSLAFAVVDKGARPQLMLHEAPKRTAAEKKEFMEKVFWVQDNIDRRQFHKNESWLCKKCEYLQLCLGEKPLLIRQDDF